MRGMFQEGPGALRRIHLPWSECAWTLQAGQVQFQPPQTNFSLKALTADKEEKAGNREARAWRGSDQQSLASCAAEAHDRHAIVLCVVLGLTNHQHLL